MLEYLTTAFVLYIAWKLYTKWTVECSMPPLVEGSIPWLGTLRGFDRRNPHKTLTDWKGRYGDIFRIKLLGENIVVVNSPDAIREGLVTNGNAIAGRPYIFRVHYGFHYAHDVIFGTFGPKWLEMKRTACMATKNYTSGLPNIDSIVEEEMAGLVTSCRSHGGHDFDPAMVVMAAVVNSLSASVMGRRFDHDDPVLVEYKRTTRLFSEACSPVNGMELDLFPWLRFFPNESFSKLRKARTLLDGFIDTQLEEVKKRFDGTHPRCILDALLLRVEEDRKSRALHAITHRDVRCMFVDLLVSGTMTSAIALNAFILYMAVHQDIQRNLQQEIDAHIAAGQHVSSRHRPSLPHMEATLYEVLRYISHVPLSLPHYTMWDTAIGPYTVPKNTQVLFNLWSLHHDEMTWEDPWSFKPSRFLDSNGQLIPPNHVLRKSFLPFGSGRRTCLGEGLAKERLFLFATTLLQNFDILMPTKPFPESLSDPREFQLGLILEPKPFEIRMKPRIQNHKSPGSDD